jgi:Flp pilus assembly pilin Flp
MLAVEVGVLVVILDMAVVAVAQFVAYAVAAILNDVYQVMFSEQRKCPEDA